jgi:hypothetical protein
VGSRRAAFAVTALSVGIAALFVMANAAAVGYDGFVAAGTLFAADAPILVTPGGGYDGQFYYRMAIEPFGTDQFVNGVEFDRPAYRQQRIVYPLLAYAVTVLTPLSVVQALVAVNVAAVGVMTYFAARIAQTFERSALFGLVLLAWPAFIFTLALDLAELVAAAAVVAAMYFAVRRKHGIAALILVVAVLTRETTILVAVAGLLVTRRWVYAWPGVALTVWHGAIWMLWGTAPLMASLEDSARSEIGLPLVGLVAGIPHWSLIDIGIFTAFVAMAWVIAPLVRVKTLPGLALVFYAALNVLLAEPVWLSWRGWARASIELVIMAYVIRVAGDRELPGDERTPATNALPPPASTPV